MFRKLAPFVAALLVLVATPTAEAAQRYAAPGGSTTSQCPAADPCTIERAVNGAAAGDEVIVASGDYTLSSALNPRGVLNLHGDPDHAWPRITASGKMSGTVLTFKGGTLSHVSLQAVNPDREALELEAGIADGIRALSNAGTGATVSLTDSGTVLRNSVVRSLDPKSGATALDVKDGHGSVALRNVTVIAGAGSGTGIRCDVKDGTASIVNAIVRGKAADIDARSRLHRGVLQLPPGVLDRRRTRHRQPERRPAVRRRRLPAGGRVADDRRRRARRVLELPGPRRPAAQPRRRAGHRRVRVPAAGDAAATSSTTSLPEDLKGVPLPQQGRSVVVGTERGTVRIRRPGAKRFTTLDEPGRIPLGSLIDARNGRVQLVTAIDQGRVQAGTFWGSKFATSQRRTGGGMTTLTLRTTPSRPVAPTRRAARWRSRAASASASRACGPATAAAASAPTATTASPPRAARPGSPKTAARARTRASIEGAVSVHDLTRHKRVLVKAGHSYLARSRK